MEFLMIKNKTRRREEEKKKKAKVATHQVVSRLHPLPAVIVLMEVGVAVVIVVFPVAVHLTVIKNKFGRFKNSTYLCTLIK